MTHFDSTKKILAAARSAAAPSVVAGDERARTLDAAWRLAMEDELEAAAAELEAARALAERASPVDVAGLEMLAMRLAGKRGDEAAAAAALAAAEGAAAAAMRGDRAVSAADRQRLRSYFVADGGGRVAHDEARREEAIVAAWRRLAVDDADAAVLHSTLLRRLGFELASIAALDTAVECVRLGRSTSHRPHWARAAHRAGEERWTEARADAEAAVELLEGASPADARDVLVLLARIRRRSGDLDAAVVAIDRAERRAPAHAELFQELAWIHFEQGRPADAADAAERALVLLPPHLTNAQEELRRLLARSRLPEAGGGEVRTAP